jgi:hypothetical protein
MKSPAHLKQDAYFFLNSSLTLPELLMSMRERVAHLDRWKDKESQVVDSFKIKRVIPSFFFSSAYVTSLALARTPATSVSQ